MLSFKSTFFLAIYHLSYWLHFQLQDLAMTMVELWTMMDTPVEEQQMFQNVTLTIAAAENELTEPNSLSLEIINDVLFLSPFHIV